MKRIDVLLLSALLTAAWFFLPESEHSQSREPVAQSQRLSSTERPNFNARKADQSFPASTTHDSAAPTVIAPPDIMLDATGLLTVVGLGAAQVQDDRDHDLVATPDQRGPFAIGTHQIHWRVTDSDGLIGEATQQVTIRNTVQTLRVEPSAHLETLFTGDRIPLHVRVEGAHHSYAFWLPETEQLWQSSDPAVADVQGGLLLAHKPGYATLRVDYGRASHEFKIEVIAGKATKLRISRRNLSPWFQYGSRSPRLEALVAGRGWVNVTVRGEWTISHPERLAWQLRDGIKAGQLLARQPGEVQLQARYAGLVDELTVNILPRRIENMSMEHPKRFMLLHEHEAVELYLHFDKGRHLALHDLLSSDELLQWRSSNPDVVALNWNGDRLTAVAQKPGETQLSFTYDEHQLSQVVQVISKVDGLLLGMMGSDLSTVGDHRRLVVIGVMRHSSLWPVVELVQSGVPLHQALRSTGVGYTQLRQGGVNLNDLAQISSTDSRVVRVEENGEITAIGKGEANIIARLDGLQSSTTVTVKRGITKTELSTGGLPGTILVGTHGSMTFYAWFDDAEQIDFVDNRVLQCQSSSPDVIALQNDGNHSFDALKIGNATLLCTLGSSVWQQHYTVVSHEGQHDVPESIEIRATRPSPFRAFDRTFIQVVANFADGSQKNIGRESEFQWLGEAIARIDLSDEEAFSLTALKQGASRLRFSYRGVSRDYALQVINQLSGVRIAPELAHLNRGDSSPLRYLRLFSDGSSVSELRRGEWKTDRPDLLELKDDTLIARGNGTAELQLRLGGFQHQIKVTVHDDQPIRLTIVPEQLNMVEGQTLALEGMIAHYADGAISRFSPERCRISFDHPGVVQMEGGYGSEWVLHARQAGYCQGNIECGGLTAPLSVMVAAARLLSLSVSSVPAEIHVGDAVQFQVTGLYDDGVSRDLTFDSRWGSFDKAVVAKLYIMKEQANHLRAIALGSGKVELTFSYGVNMQEARVSQIFTLLSAR